MMQRLMLVLSAFLGVMTMNLAAQSGSLPRHASRPATPAISLPAEGTSFFSFGATATDAVYPKNGVMQASDGNFYGVTTEGGSAGLGALYQITPAGQETVVYSFTGGNDGGMDLYIPGGTPVEASDGNIYGTTTVGGTEQGGTIYRYNLQTGTLTTVFQQPSQTTGGAVVGSLIDDGKGTLYGATAGGGTYQDGSIFSYNYRTNTFTTLYSFTGGSDGDTPETKLILGADGYLYGTDAAYLTTQTGSIFRVGTDGSNFQVLHTFTGGADGSHVSNVVQYSDGNLYGTTLIGGANGDGTFFQLVPNGANSTLNVLYTFASTDGHYVGTPFIGGDGKFYVAGIMGGSNSLGEVEQLDNQGNKADVFDFTMSIGSDVFPLFESTDGNLYGTTTFGGANSSGDVYKLATALPPVITLTPNTTAVEPGSSVTLTWAVTNAFSQSAQVCVAYSSDNSWTGLVAPSGSAHVTPTIASGIVTYAITCGGVESALATVNIGSTLFLISSTALPNGAIGLAYSATLTAANGKPPYTWSITSGSLPPGLTLTPGTGIISGTPTQNGTENFAVQATDSTGAVATASLAITITATPLTITAASLPNGVVGAAYAQSFVATGGTPPYTWSIPSGSLPAGLTLATGTGVISGTPTRAGYSTYSAQVIDSEGSPAIATANGAATILPAESSFPPKEVVLWSFPGSTTDGVQPSTGLIQASDGYFYGTTCCGGAYGGGVLYRLPGTGTPGVETVVADFSYTTTSQGGYGPNGTLVEASDGNLYGVTSNAGANKAGTIYQYNLKTGVLATVFSFPAQIGVQYPGGNSLSDLIDDGSGTLYGTSSTGGTHGMGSAWAWNYLTNTFTMLHDFTGNSDGAYPYGGLLLASDGNLYGLNIGGGTSVYGTAYALGTDGSNFQVIHNFTGGTDGGNAYSELVQYSDGNLYGFANSGGANGLGVFFQIIPNGVSSTLKTLYSFKATDGNGCNGVDGCAYPGFGHPLIGGDGKFYLATHWGGAQGNGQVMQLDTLGNKADVFDFSIYNGNAASQPFEGTDGNLYGTNYIDAVYELLTNLPPVISLTAGTTDVAPGDSVTLKWAVTNAFSKSAQACIARSTDNSWTGLVATSGTATVTPTGAAAVAYSVTCGGTETARAVINGNTPLVIANSTLPNGRVNATYSAALTASGGTPPYTWAVFGGTPLPSGLSLSPSTGLITGVPIQAGTSNITVQATDSETAPANTSTNLSIAIAANPLAITTASLSNGAVGVAYSQSLGATGGTTPYTWSITSGNLPAGLTLTPKSGLISGTPTTTGTGTFTVQVADAEATPTTVTAIFTVTINAQLPAITTTSLPNGTVGAAYSQALAASGGTAPYTWSIKSGSLPPGLSLAVGTGVISGTPAAAEVSTFTVRVSDSESTPATAVAALGIVIDAPVPITPTVTASVNPSSITAGQGTTFTATVSGPSGSPVPTGTVQFQSNGSNIGSPVALSGGTATLSSQTFATAGSYSITANYPGDTNYTSANSSATTLMVTAASPALTVNPSNVTISAPGGMGTATLTVANFSSTSVTFVCTGLPTGAACSAGVLSTSGTSTLRITTTGASTSASMAPPAGRHGSGIMVAMALPGLLAIAGLFTTQKRWRRMFLLALLLSAGITLTACGGGSAKTTSNETPAGTSTVTVTATAGSQTASTKITLVVQ